MSVRARWGNARGRVAATDSHFAPRVEWRLRSQIEAPALICHRRGCRSLGGAWESGSVHATVLGPSPVRDSC
jgi:hypothetical protein